MDRGLLNIIEKPNTPPKLVISRNNKSVPADNFNGGKSIGFKWNSNAMIQAVMVATTMITMAYARRSRPERISSLARSIPLVINGKPGIINSIEQIYPASCCSDTEKKVSASLRAPT